MAKKSKKAPVEMTTLEANTVPALDEPTPEEPVEGLPPVFEDKARDDLFDKYQKQQEELNAVATEEPVEVAEAPPEETPSETPEPVADTPEQPPETKYKIVVDGQSIEYTLDELLQQAQLGVGARKKFDEAAQLRQQAALERQQVQQLMFASQQNSQPQPAANTQLPDIPETELKDIAKRLNYGSEDEQVKALKDAGILFTKAAGQPNQLSPEALVQAATQNAMNAMTIQQENSIIQQEYKDIIADPPLAMATEFIATQLAQKYLALGQQISRLELMREAGREARERYLRPAAEQPNSPVQPTVVVDNGKIERKRTAPQPPAAASKISSDSTSETKTLSPEQAVEAMRREAFKEIVKSRGASAY